MAYKINKKHNFINIIIMYYFCLFNTSLKIFKLYKNIRKIIILI